MERRIRRYLGEFARRDRRASAGGGPLPRGDRDSEQSLHDAVRFRDLPRSLTELVQRPGEFDPKDFEPLTQPSDVRPEAKRRPPVDSDGLEASVAVEEAAILNRDARLDFGKDGPVNPCEGRPRSPPRGLA